MRLAVTENGDFAYRIAAAVVGDRDTGKWIAEAAVGGAQHAPAIDGNRHAAIRVAVDLNAMAKIIFQVERLIVGDDGTHAARAETLQFQGRLPAGNIGQVVAGAARAPLVQIEREAAMLFA